MKITTLLITLFITLFSQAQQTDQYIYLRNDTITEALYQYINEDIIDHDFFQKQIMMFDKKNNKWNKYSKNQFISNKWIELIKFYRNTDLIILRHNKKINEYLIYNRCHKHLVVMNNKKQISQIEVLENDENELPCHESSR